MGLERGETVKLTFKLRIGHVNVCGCWQIFVWRGKSFYAGATMQLTPVRRERGRLFQAVLQHTIMRGLDFWFILATTQLLAENNSRLQSSCPLDGLDMGT